MEILAQEPNIHVHLFIEDAKLVKVSLESPTPKVGFSYSWDQELPSKDLEKQILEFLVAYSHKKPISSSFLPLQKKPSAFFTKALERVSSISFGQTKSYKEIAEALQNPKAARAIGSACHYNSYPLFIPCHRVIASNGHLRGFATGLHVKQELLRFEKS